MNFKLKTAIAAVALAACTLFVGSRSGESQAGALTVAIYAPSVNFGTSAGRLQYLQRLSKAISSATGRRVDPKPFNSLGALLRSKPDFAVVEGQCVAAKGYKVLANAVVGGGTSRRWALYSNAGRSMSALKGKKLAYMKTGCRDESFIENAMLESEVSLRFFGGRVGKRTLSGAVAEVATLRGAQAVFAPAGSQKGLGKVFDAGSVPNPAFVQLNQGLPAGVVTKAKGAVTNFAGGGAISRWRGGNQKTYSGLRGRMGKRVKRGMFARPTPVRVKARDVLIYPKTLDDTSLTEVTQHFDQPPARQGDTGK
jgi:hypothetical protein